MTLFEKKRFNFVSISTALKIISNPTTEPQEILKSASEKHNLEYSLLEEHVIEKVNNFYCDSIC